MDANDGAIGDSDRDVLLVGVPERYRDQVFGCAEHDGAELPRMRFPGNKLLDNGVAFRAPRADSKSVRLNLGGLYYRVLIADR